MTDRQKEDGQDSGGRDGSGEWQGGRGKSELLSRGCVQVFSVISSHPPLHRRLVKLRRQTAKGCTPSRARA